MDKWQFRHRIYRTLADTGAAPATELLASWAGDSAEAQRLLGVLHEDHSLVLDDAGAIRMALPFSAVETAHRVAASNLSWWANCAWDALAIPVAIGVDAEIDAPWMDTGKPVGLQVRGGRLSPGEGFIHFVVPARHWWDDIVET